MSGEDSPSSTTTSPSARRASFSPGQKLSELFGRSPTSGGTGPPLYPNPITTAAANAQAQQRRRLSITSLGLSGSPTHPSAIINARARQESISAASSPSSSIDESAVEDGDATPSSSPTFSFARRMSSGARALRDVRIGNENANGRSSTHSTSPLPTKGRGEGFNWSEQLRSRAERSASIAAPPSSIPETAVPSNPVVPNTGTVEPPAKQRPMTPKAPDHFQERILKGDFYMD